MCERERAQCWRGRMQAERREFVQPYAQGMPLGKRRCFASKKTMIQSLLYGEKKGHTEFNLDILSSVTPETTCQGKRERINLSQWILVPWLCARHVYHCTVLPVIARGSFLSSKGQRDCSQGSGDLQSCHLLPSEVQRRTTDTPSWDQCVGCSLETRD